MLTGPEFVARKVLARAGMKPGDIDLYELNEAFAAVVLLFMQKLEIPHDKINVNGGAIAMGHPLGATGAMILGTLLDEMERRDLETGPRRALRRRRHGHCDHHRAAVARKPSPAWRERVASEREPGEGGCAGRAAAFRPIRRTHPHLPRCAGPSLSRQAGEGSASHRCAREPEPEDEE
ncbi:MAG: hypothetical protein WDN69_14800 [Aliidongia sp.]